MNIFQSELVADIDLHLTKDEIAAFNNIVWKMYERNRRVGFHDHPVEDGTRLALCHSELSEALEGFRKDKMDDHLSYRKAAEVELADAVIRIMDLAMLKGFDLGNAMAEKHRYNMTRKDHTREHRAGPNGKKF